MGVLDKSVSYGIGLLVLFLIGGVLVLPMFSDAYRYCQTVKWAGAHGTGTGNCTYDDVNFNTSEITAGSTGQHTESSLGTYDIEADHSADRYCLKCVTEGGWRTTTQGLVILVLVVGMIAFALYFFPKKISIGV